MSDITRDQKKLRAMSDADLFRWRREAREIMSRRRSRYLAVLHDRLTQDETRALTQCGFAEHYVVIRPFSPLSLPEPQAVTEITSAIRTLERHRMLVQAPDAGDRDDDC